MAATPGEFCLSGAFGPIHDGLEDLIGSTAASAARPFDMEVGCGADGDCAGVVGWAAAESVLTTASMVDATFFERFAMPGSWSILALASDCTERCREMTVVGLPRASKDARMSFTLAGLVDIQGE